MRAVAGGYGTLPGGVFFRAQVISLLDGASSPGAGHYAAGPVYGVAGPLLLLLEAAGRYQPLLVTNTEMRLELGYRSRPRCGSCPTRAESARRTNEAGGPHCKACSGVVRTDLEQQDRRRGRTARDRTGNDPGGWREIRGTSGGRTTPATLDVVFGARGGQLRLNVSGWQSAMEGFDVDEYGVVVMPP